MVTAADVGAARPRVYRYAVATPLVEAPGLGAAMKNEAGQPTGSFKIRGAASKILALSPSERERGIVAVSSGNHGRAVAHVAAGEGIRAVVCITTRVPDVKADAIRASGAEARIAGDTQDDAEAEAIRLRDHEGMTYVHPFDDPLVIAGQGTIGLEIAEQVPDVDEIVVPLSGGGLISGIALAVRAERPTCRIVGVSQDRGPAMVAALRAGHIVAVEEQDTLADALAGGLGIENHNTLRLCRELVDAVALVSETEIASAMAWTYRNTGLMLEGGGAVAIAAVLTGKVEAGSRTVAVASGGNVDPQRFQEILANA